LNSDPGVRTATLAPVAVAVSCLLVAIFASGCVSIPSNSSARSSSPSGDPPLSVAPPSTPQAAPISVAVTPPSSTIQLSQTQTFIANVSNDPKNAGVTWSLSSCAPGACGTLSATTSASGAPITYTAPTQMPAGGSIALTATSVTDSAKSASTAITITAPPPAKITVSVSPQSQKFLVNQTQNFTATVQNDSMNKGVSWTFSGAQCKNGACGALSATTSSSGTPITYTAPAQPPNPPNFALIATSVADSRASASASIAITAPAPQITVVVSPTGKTVPVNQSQDFTASVQNDSQNKGVTWTLSGPGCSGVACGTLSSGSSPSGSPITYTAPANAPNPPNVTLTAISVADHKASASATITVFAIPVNLGVTISPKRGGITLSQTLKFSATVQNDPTNEGVTWTASSGTFSNVTPTSAIYHPPTNAGVYIITAASNLDTTKRAASSIGVTDLSGVTTYHNDSTRAGVNSREFALNPSNVHASFAKLFSCPVDASVYTQTLWVADLSIAGGTHNVIFTATSHDTVYAFDADASPCVTYWSNQLVPSGETWPTAADMGGDDIQPDTGVVGTPVIDPVTKILYVVTKTKTVGTDARGPGQCHQRLHALSLVNGKETANGPFDLTASITVPGSGDGGNGTAVPFDPFHENQRPGLALVNNTVYVAWASYLDQKPWHGWIMAFDKSDLGAAPTLFNATPNGEGAGIWMAGGAPSVDSNNNIYAITGNGDYDGAKEFGDSFLKLNTNLVVQDWFTPADQAVMDSGNGDLGSGGAAVLADLPSAPVKHLLIGGGKVGSGQAGELYLINRDAMGHLEGSGGPPLVQKFPVMRHIFATPAFWNNTLFIAGANGPLQAYALSPTTGLFNPTPASSSPELFQGRGATASVSADGNSHGVAWAVDTSQYGGSSPFGTGPAVLHAYDATNLGHELWNSAQAAGNRDQAGNAVKFTVPTIANGKVYIGTTSEIDVYGLLPD
jgi:hypothetical protein